MTLFEAYNDKYYAETITAANALVDMKVALHKHDRILDDKIDDYKARLGELDGNCDALKAESASIEKLIKGANNVAVTPENVEQLVYPANAISEKLIKL